MPSQKQLIVLNQKSITMNASEDQPIESGTGYINKSVQNLNSGSATQPKLTNQKIDKIKNIYS